MTNDLIVEPSESTKSARTINIESKRFVPDGPVYGMGTWGVVAPFFDRFLGEEVAIKDIVPTETALEQMAQRNLTTLKVTQKEAGRLAACSNIVPRQVEFDDNGHPFLVLPRMKKFLGEVLCDKYDRTRLGYGLTLDQILRYSKGIAHSCYEMHYQMKQTHIDGNPMNFAIDGLGKILLNDIGTGTCASISKRSGDARNNMGFALTRAPECFRPGKEGDATTRSDVWTVGALIYRMFAGEYPLQHEIDDGTIFDEKKIDKIIKAKIKKNIPKGLRSFLTKCLTAKRYSRYDDGEALEKGLVEAIERMDTTNYTKKILKKFALPLTLPLAAGALLLYNVSNYKPTHVELPKPALSTIIPFEDGKGNLNILGFNREQIPGLPEKSGLDQYTWAKTSTDNIYAAKLIETYEEAVKAGGGVSGGFFGASYLTKAQEAYFQNYVVMHGGIAYVNPQQIPAPVMAVVKSVEFGLAMAAKESMDGKPDLEDACAYARLGYEVVMSAKLAAGSKDYAIYRDAKNPKGDRIIPIKERQFIDQWLGETTY